MVVEAKGSGSPDHGTELPAFRAEGVVPADNPPYAIAGWVAEATPEQQDALWRRSIAVLARIHTHPNHRLEELLPHRWTSAQA